MKKEVEKCGENRRLRLLFQDEAGFGRINKPKYCWCSPGIRPHVPCHHIREYRYAYGAVEPLTGESFFLVLPYANTDCTNIFLDQLSKKYQEDHIVLVCDGASWHKSKKLYIPPNVQLLFLPPYTKHILKTGTQRDAFFEKEKGVLTDRVPVLK